MDKEQIRTALVLKLEQELAVQTHAALDARDEATSAESKSEGKYDMRSQEAAYLAEGQARLATEIATAINLFRTLPLAAPADGRVAAGSLVTLAAGNRRSLYFIGPSRGGLDVEIDGATITVVTPQSPLGRQLLGLRAGDEIKLPARTGVATQKVSAVA